MRLAVLADIHGNLPALEAVLAELRQQDVDGFIIAGDHLTGGPNPDEVIPLLRSLDGWLIRGNTDNRLLAYDAGNVPDSWRVSEQWAALRWLHGQLDREMLDFIASLPEQAVVAPDGTAPIRVVHGSLKSPSEHLIPDRDPMNLALFRKAGLLPPNGKPPQLELTLAQIQEAVLICGHSHIPWQQKHEGRLAFNPGSVGHPNNGDTRAQYALLTWQDGRWQVEHCAVAYNLEQVRLAYQASGLLAAGGAFIRAFLLGIETGQAVPGHFVTHVHNLAQAAGFEGDGVFPEPIWEQAVATFNWEARAYQ
ncbi:MAG: metallophosphoesterase family protein [Anaerolineae bacterium]|nr:metallophosphoesterase family protein [Anaerolineae bacterium]